MNGMKLKSIFFCTLISLCFILLNANQTHAITESACINNYCSNAALSSEILNYNAFSKVSDELRYDSANSQLVADIEYTWTGGGGKSFCGVLSQRQLVDNLIENTILSCQIIPLRSTEGSNTQTAHFTYKPNKKPSSGEYTFAVGARSNDTNDAELVRFFENAVNLVIEPGDSIPTPSPTQVPGEDCVGQSLSFAYAGTCCDPENDANDLQVTVDDQEKRLPYCDGYKCDPLPDNLLDTQPSNPDQTIICKKEGGWVQADLYKRSDEDIKKAVDQATQSCGYLGEQCCLPNVLPPPHIDNWMTKYILDPLQNWIYDVIGIESMTKDIETDINNITGGTICKQTGTVPEISFTDETPPKVVDNVFFAGNEKDDEEPHYQFTPSDRYTDQQICINWAKDVEGCKDASTTPTIIPLTPTPIPESEVESCTCVSVDGETTDVFSSDVVNPNNISIDEIQQQICSGDRDCMICLDKKMYWQDWLNKGEQCVADKEMATDNLNKYINPDQPQGNNTSTIAEADKPSVLGITFPSSRAPALKQLQQYIEACSNSGLSEEMARACGSCRENANFWGSWGCSKTYVDVGHILNLCRTLDGEEYESCKICTSSGRMWTAIGCVDINLQGIIQEQIFGWGIGLAGVSAILCIIYSAFILQTSGNNPEKIKQAQDTMTACITGLVVIILSVFILNVIGVDILRIPGFRRGTTSPNTSDGRCTYPPDDVDCITLTPEP